MERLRDVEGERAEWLAGLAPERLEDVLSYRTLNGQAYAHKLADLVRHVVNHSSYHRGQAATQLRQLGRVPPATDLVVFLREE